MVYLKVSRRGFTLVELSIVLVVIGLLIGGVLAGRDLISKSRLRKVITEAQQLRTAVTTFRAQYGWLPGDMPNASQIWPNNVWGSDPSGNGNGVIDLYNGEPYPAWYELFLAGMYPQWFQNYHTNEPIPGRDVPQSSYGANAGWMMYSGDAYNGYPYSFSNAHIIIYAMNQLYINRPDGPVLAGFDALSIDQKIDDGKAGGQVMGLTGANQPTPCFIYDNTTQSYSYVTTATIPVCALSFMIE